MKIAIYSQYYTKKTSEAFAILLDVLLREKISVCIEKEFLKQLDEKVRNNTEIQSFTELDKSFNLLISIGGDGTILRTITYVKDLNIPIVGINTGRLGFLATIQTDEIEEAFISILNKQYKISERSLLSVETSPENKDILEANYALNEIAVSRKNTTSMITVDTLLDNEYLTSYWSDGLIVSTPTGSTGYSLSCGGPVITPSTNSFVLTPIAPHNLSARPLVIPDSTEIELKVNGRENQHLVSLDSRIATLDNNTVIKIKKAPFTIKMLELLDESFLDTLRKKLLWGEDKRN
ncbi:NAD+ kinase [Oceanihabitans sediminis]|uniref:NAD kinase n=1 Tax=Oceanihabitans sediminis TaxID=1812012 RepID=A0A368P894_9FLAO|nr:NAD kinase [Oceanihabitans sediminis]RBP34337.1 NAD+ kinase [Oceanihabitans sediminis]RCU58019.1 NAD kinase [Oceanihabitans sediminis]